MERVLKNEKLHVARLITGLPVKKKPLLIVHDVPSNANGKGFLSGLRQQNLDSTQNSKFQEEVRKLHRNGNRNSEINLVIEVSPSIRETLLKQDRIYNSWHAQRIRDYLTECRCYKCQSFGHVSKYCKAENGIYGHCSSEGHAFKNCLKKNSNPTCINCKRAAKP